MPSTSAAPVVLQDPKLFRQACYINGAWVDASPQGSIAFDNPATG
jgi:succinate-semialdehyde dehydrogenase / glutarate-semialdehyde dehydrogenase